jgi:predicted small secreted protein
VTNVVGVASRSHHTVAAASLAAASVLLAGCGGVEDAAQDVQNRAEERAKREAFCAQWRLLKEAGDGITSPAVVEAIRNERDQLLDLVPAEDRPLVDEVLDDLGKLAGDAGNLADQTAGTFDEATRAAVEADLAERAASLDERCAGTLTG